MGSILIHYLQISNLQYKDRSDLFKVTHQISIQTRVHVHQPIAFCPTTLKYSPFVFPKPIIFSPAGENRHILKIALQTSLGFQLCWSDSFLVPFWNEPKLSIAVHGGQEGGEWGEAGVSISFLI